MEDPTNRSPVFARNRIRMSLRNLSSRMLKSELQATISACRKTRSFVDHTCHNLINQAVAIMDHGYAVIDLKKLDPSNIEDLCLSKFAAVILQFISQRHKPVHGSTTQLLLNYIRSYPCKTSLTAAGCYLCAAPGSKGTKILVCYSSNSPQPSRMESHKYSGEGQNRCLPSEIEQIIMKAKSYSDRLLSDILDVPFLHVTSSESILNEAKKLNILSESTCESILLLRREESKHFSSQKALQPVYELKRTMKSASGPTETLQAGQLCHFMDRFFVRWNMCEKTRTNRLPADKTDFDWELKGRSQDLLCSSCVVGQNAVAVVRHMVDADWLYLANLSNVQKSEENQTQRLLSMEEMEQEALRKVKCSDYLQLSAQSALPALKSIPAAARRGLPVLVDPHGLLLSVPAICFKHCPYLSVNAEFKPRVPLGGGYSSYI